MFIEYKKTNFRADALKKIEQANEIIDDMRSQGYTLTLRQLYYKFVSKDLIENSVPSYKNLGSLISKARYAGLISWSAIEDRNRTAHTYEYENEDEHEALRGIETFISLDFWARQEDYMEVWVEKDALINVIERPCQRHSVPHMACKGSLSSSAAFEAGKRFADAAERGKRCTLIYLGDHDPTGIDITRDNQDRLDIFAPEAGVHVLRVALNMDQVQKYNPPPNPAKETDSRFKGYAAKYGDTCWELDALEPSVIEAVITKEIKKRIDTDIWNDTLREQTEKRALLKDLYNRWDDIKPLLQQWRNEEGEE